MLVAYAYGMVGKDGYEKEFVKQIRAKQMLMVEVLINKLVVLASLSLLTCVASSDVVFSIEAAVAAHYANMRQDNRAFIDQVTDGFNTNLRDSYVKQVHPT